MERRITAIDRWTGTEVPESEVETTEWLFMGQEGKLEATKATLAALLAGLQDDPSKLVALLAPTKAAPAKRPRVRGHGGGEHAQAREWCRTPEGKAAILRIGKQPTDKGRMPSELINAYRNRQAA